MVTNNPDHVEVNDAKLSALENLAAHHRVASAATDNRLDAIRMARRFGATWTECGKAMGMSRQAAHKRFAHLVGETGR